MSTPLCPRCQQPHLLSVDEDVHAVRWMIDGQEVCAECFAEYEQMQAAEPPAPQAPEPTRRRMIRKVGQTL